MTSEESTLPRPGDVLADKYRVERLLGAGGMGSVFEVVHRVTGKRFAIKWLLPELSANDDAVKRFIREAQVAGRFDHPNVVEVYDIGQERGSLYMVMELLRGESLATHLARVRRLSAAEAARILIPCLQAVSRAHRAGIIHRDLKPGNIFLCRGADGAPDYPKVLDFGISKIMSGGEVDSHVTKGGLVMGTPHYMAPEQVRGRAIDARVDIYAFGVLLYELTSGKLPFPGDTYGELVLQIATQGVTPLNHVVPGLPAGFAELVQRAMARSVEDRFQTPEALVQALEPFAEPPHAAPRATPYGTGRDQFVSRSGRTPFGRTVAIDTPLVSERAATALPTGWLDANRLPWMVALLATAVAALIVTLVLLRPSAQTAAPATFTTRGAAVGVAPAPATLIPSVDPHAAPRMELREDVPEERSPESGTMGTRRPRELDPHGRVVDAVDAAGNYRADERRSSVDRVADSNAGGDGNSRVYGGDSPSGRRGSDTDALDDDGPSAPHGARAPGDNVIGPWKRQVLPGRGARGSRVNANDEFGEQNIPDDEDRRRPRSKKSSTSFGVRMKPNEF